MSDVSVRAPFASVIFLRNPFAPADREVFSAPDNLSISQWLNAQAPQVSAAVQSQPTICLKNGHPVLRSDWAVTKVEGAIIFVALPQGGGGGGGKNPLRTVLMIAVMVVANVYGGPLASALGFSGSLGTAVASAGIALAGSVLVNALVPLPTPNVPTAGSLNSPSPTYSLQAQGNYARLTQPIPVVYGHHLVFPDFASTPYAEYVDHDQYLHQLHVIGMGEYEIHQIRIEDTPIQSFAEIQAQVILPGGINTLFNHDVVTAPEVAGQELIALADPGGAVVGPFTVNPPQTQVSHIGIDVLMLRGLYYANDDGSLSAKSVQWRVIARSGNYQINRDQGECGARAAENLLTEPLAGLPIRFCLSHRKPFIHSSRDRIPDRLSLHCWSLSLSSPYLRLSAPNALIRLGLRSKHGLND